MPLDIINQLKKHYIYNIKKQKNYGQSILPLHYNHP